MPHTDGAAVEATVAEELAVTASLIQRSTVHVHARGAGSGSGTVWSEDGLIITNNHVARGPHARVELADGRKFEAVVSARDPQRDLAALRIEAHDLAPATIADSDQLRVGEVVVAVGNPLGLTGALTFGIVHAIAPAEGHGPRSWVHADVHLAPGNSGGPLVDARGHVVGINSMVAGGLGLAVPSNAVQAFLGRRRERSRVGIRMQPVTIRVHGAVQQGIVVLEIETESPASRAGLLIGDVIVGLEGQSARNANEIVNRLNAMREGSAHLLDILRGGVSMQARVVLNADLAKEEAEQAA